MSLTLDQFHRAIKSRGCDVSSSTIRRWQTEGRISSMSGHTNRRRWTMQSVDDVIAVWTQRRLVDAVRRADPVVVKTYAEDLCDLLGVSLD